MQKESKPYWADDVYFLEGEAWATQLTKRHEVGVDSISQSRSIIDICLGSEEVILPILKGDMPIPENFDPNKRELLKQVLRQQNGGRK